MKNLIVVFAILLLLASCKTKYEELLVKYETNRNKKNEAIKDRKHFESLIKTTNDTIKTLLPEHRFWKRYSDEAAEIAGLKADFIKNGMK